MLNRSHRPAPRHTASSNRALSRRDFCAAMTASLTSPLAATAFSNSTSSLRLRYILGSCMYGYTNLREILPEVRKTGAAAIDIWPKAHGSQREQLAEMGEEAFANCLRQHDVALGCITQYKLGPFGLQEEMRIAERLGCRTIVTGGSGPVGLSGGELKTAVAKFVEKMKPHLAVAEETGVTIAIENHGNNLIDSPDSLKWLVELRPSAHLAVALAPYHLPQDPQLLSVLIRTLGNAIEMFYAWQHGLGCMNKLPKDQELLQMPGRGQLDFGPLLAALRRHSLRRLDGDLHAPRTARDPHSPVDAGRYPGSQSKSRLPRTTAEGYWLNGRSRAAVCLRGTIETRPANRPHEAAVLLPGENRGELLHMAKQMLIGLFLLLTTPVTGTGEDSLVARWRFDSSLEQDGALQPSAGSLSATIENARIVPGDPSYVELDGKESRVTVTHDLTSAMMPVQSLTVEAWVAIESPGEWGGFVSALQDNGDYERGWLLGYRQSQFCFGLAAADKGRITYLTATTPFATGDWYYLAATYDGRKMRLYIDGSLAAESTEQTGAVIYPPTGVFAIGGYRDDNEFYPMEGRVAEVSVHRKALSEHEIRKCFDRRKTEFPGIVPSLEPGAGWPTYMRDNSRTGVTAEELQLPLQPAWVYRASHPPKPAWPQPAKQNFWKEELDLPARVIYDRAMHVVSDGASVYFGSSADDKFYCLDLRSGRERWSFFTEGPVRLARTLWHGRVYGGSDDGAVYCLAAKDGRLHWRFRPSSSDRRIAGNGRIVSTLPVRSGVMIDGEHVRFAAGLFPTQGTYQYLLDAETGKERAKGQLPFSPQGYMQKRGNSLLIARGRAPQVFLAKLERSGKPLSADTTGLTERYPFCFISSGSLRFAGGDGEVAAFAAADGRKLWSAPVDGRAYSLAVAGSCLLVSTDTGHICCFRSGADADRPVMQPAPKSARVRGADSAAEPQQTAIVSQILQRAGTRRGYCLVLGNQTGWMAQEIARQTQLTVVGLDSDPSRVDALRRRLDEAGLYGRVSIHHGPVEKTPYAANLFNVIVSESMFESGRLPCSTAEIKRLLQPGGTAILATSDMAADRWKVITNEPLQDAGSWTHMYADTANTACSGDRHLNGKLTLQWFGQPGPREMVDRHHRTVPPLFAAGRLFVPADNRVIAVDAYNGTVLWNVAVPESRRVGALRDCGHMVAAEDVVYVAARDRCLGFDAADGTCRMAVQLPPREDNEPRHWGYVARVENLLFGSTTRPGASRTGHSRRMIDETYYDFVPMVTSDSVFAVDRHNGQLHWCYRPPKGAILNSSITIGGGQMFFIESNNAATLAQSTGRSTLDQMLRAQGAYLVAIGTETGKETWRRHVKLGELEHQLFMAYANQKIMIVGSRNQTREDNEQAVWFDIHCHDATDGTHLWATSQNQQKAAGGSHGEQDQHPIIVDGTIFVEPFAYDLASGRRRKDWKLDRGGHGCGTVSASATACFFRADNPTMCDLATGQQQKVNLVSRPGCWINMIPAGGLLLIPEASSGCVCDFPIQSSMAFAPAE